MTLNSLWWHDIGGKMAKTLNIGTTPSGAGQVLENRPSVRYKIRKQIENQTKEKGRKQDGENWYNRGKQSFLTQRHNQMLQESPPQKGNVPSG